MSELSRNERRQVESTLKEFAFEQSPMFKQNLAQSMSIEHSYQIQDDWEKRLPKDIVNQDPQADSFSPDSTTITVGFEANRILSDYQKRPIYRFAARLIFSTFLLPSQVKLPDDDWAKVTEDLSAYLDEDFEDIEDVSKTDIINTLSDNMIACEKYRRIDYEYETFHGTIQVNEEAGYLIEEVPYGVIETHPASESGPLYAEDNPLANIDSAALTDISVNDAKFEQTVADLRQHYEDYGDLMMHEDKFNEFNHLLQLIKNRVINL